MTNLVSMASGDGKNGDERNTCMSRICRRRKLFNFHLLRHELMWRWAPRLIPLWSRPTRLRLIINSIKNHVKVKFLW